MKMIGFMCSDDLCIFHMKDIIIINSLNGTTPLSQSNMLNVCLGTLDFMTLIIKSPSYSSGQFFRESSPLPEVQDQDISSPK